MGGKEEVICVSDSDDEESGLEALRRVLGNLDKLLEDENRPPKIIKKQKKQRRGVRGFSSLEDHYEPWPYGSARSANVKSDGTGFGGSQVEDMSHFLKTQEKVKQFDEVVAELFDSLSFKLKRVEDEDEGKELMINSSGLSKALHKFLKNDLMDVCRRSKAYTPLLNCLDGLARNMAMKDLLLRPLTCSGWVKRSTQSSETAQTSKPPKTRRSQPLPPEDDSDSGDTVASMIADLGQAARSFVKFDKRNGENGDYTEVCLSLEELSITFDRLLKGGSAAHEEAAASSSSSSSKEDWKVLAAKNYVTELKKLSFEVVNLVERIEQKEIGFSFNLDHSDCGQYAARFWPEMVYGSGGAGAHARKSAPLAPGVASKGRNSRIASEVASLASSLPIEYASSIFVRVDEDRPDIIKALIIGPEDTPYANGCFEFDILLPLDYPNSPPKVKFLTTGGGRVRFNPNLYEDGKVCLSLLGTWAGPSWKPDTSSLLQVLISIQALILVAEPYWNEPGHEGMRTTPHGKMSSQRYDERIKYYNIRYALLRACVQPSPVFEDVIHKHMVLKHRAIVEQLDAMEKEFTKMQQQREQDAKKAREAAAGAAAGGAAGKKHAGGGTHHSTQMMYFGGPFGDMLEERGFRIREDLPEQIKKLKSVLSDLESGTKPHFDPKEDTDAVRPRHRFFTGNDPAYYGVIQKGLEQTKKKLEENRAHLQVHKKKIDELRKANKEKFMFASKALEQKLIQKANGLSMGVSGLDMMAALSGSVLAAVSGSGVSDSPHFLELSEAMAGESSKGGISSSFIDLEVEEVGASGASSSKGKRREERSTSASSLAECIMVTVEDSCQAPAAEASSSRSSKRARMDSKADLIASAKTDGDSSALQHIAPPDSSHVIILD